MAPTRSPNDDEDEGSRRKDFAWKMGMLVVSVCSLCLSADDREMVVVTGYQPEQQ